MKKILPVLLGLFALALVACQPQGSTPTGGEQTPPVTGGEQTPPATEPGVTVESVELKMQDDSDIPSEVFDGSSLRLSATVKGSEQGLKVTWESSNKDLATVTNGVVKFGKVAEDSEVTISAVSKDDNTKKASHTFKIKHCLIDLANSRGNNLDTSLFMDEGSIVAEAGDIAFKFADVHHSKFYVEATITIDSQLESDAYPKFGIMIGSDETTSWNTTTSDTVVKNAFFYGDQQQASQSSGWTSFNFVPQNAEHTDWAWAGQIGGFNVSNENKWVMGEGYTIGLLRDGVNYYLFAKNGDGLKCYKHVVYTDFAADEPCYAWVGGWATGVTVSNFKCLLGDDANAMYAEPTTLDVANESPIVFINSTYQINLASDVTNLNLGAVSYVSDNETVATVDANGLVTATSTVGTANITVSYGNLSKNVKVTVTDDLKVNVVLDGKMDDALWTDTVKTNKFVFNRNTGTTLIDVYGSRNSLGIYLFFEYQSTGDYSSAPEWWQANNVELRIMNTTNLIRVNGNDQFWASDFSGGQSNFTGHYVSAPKLNEATQMYELVFELFLSYEHLGVSKDELIAISIGCNDGGNDRNGWYNTAEGMHGYGWLEPNFAKAIKVHEDGLFQPYYPESFCGENHEYGDWVTLTQASCAGDGEEARFCKWCNHKDSRVLPAGEHSYDYANLVVEVVPTCETEGSGYIPCNGGCGTNKDVTLDKDFRNHTAHDYDAPYCSNCNHTVEITRWDAGGWGNVNDWVYAVKDLAGDFVVTTTYSIQTNGIAGNWWRGVLAIVQEELPAGVEGEGSPWVTRMDWWGWCDQWQSGDKLTHDFDDDQKQMGAMENINRDAWWTNAEGGDVNSAQFEAAMTNGTIEWTCTRTGTTIRNDFKITSSTGEVFTFWTVANDVAADKHISLGLNSEFANYQVTSVVISQ